jgi:hypothetical protein
VAVDFLAVFRYLAWIRIRKCAIRAFLQFAGVPRDMGLEIGLLESPMAAARNWAEELSDGDGQQVSNHLV